MTIQQEIQTLLSEFELFDDVMDKYEYIIELGKSLKGLEARYKTDIYKVQGCQSQVWLHAFIEDGLVTIQADGDALIAKGLVAILMRIYSQKSAQEILKSNPDDLALLGLSEIISAGRQNGIASMLRMIYLFAKEHSDEK